ncbi:MAG: hypothetical protein DME26_22175 [Verrucomicrobia bacterium]|nr:MAG: hypothetical protein DME26_22175 [Verrucomicrobiota bacterium]
MLAIGDAIYFWGLVISGFGFGTAWTTHGSTLGRGSNAVFCDGHVETSDHRLIVKTNTAGAEFPAGFMPDAAHAKRWNNDNEPHPETWR